MTRATAALLLLALAGWMNRQQQAAIDYLREENRILREQLGGRRLRFTDDQRRRLAAKAGASYVSPFVGRLDDVGHDGMEGVEQIKTIFDNYGYTTEIIVASVRSPLHVLEAGLMGADICTIPYSVMLQLMKHPLTDIGIDKFLADWAKAQK